MQILNLQSTITKMKYVLGSNNSKLNTTIEKSSELENRQLCDEGQQKGAGLEGDCQREGKGKHVNNKIYIFK